MTVPIEIAPMSAPASLPGFDVARPLALLLVLVGTLTSAGCSSPVDRAVATMPVSEDYRLRHPVVLANAPQRLDIFFVGPTGQLDVPQARQVEAFARSYLADGQGALEIGMPEGPVDHAAAERTLAAVRRALLHYGVKGRVSLSAYPVRDPAIASPLHLSYVSLQARPTTRCGEWPDDLGSGATLATWNNHSYYNLGCASQQTLAAQIADPRDLVKPRALDPTDVQLRTRAIQSLRGTSTVTGADPSTTWANNPTAIGPAGQF